MARRVLRNSPRFERYANGCCCAPPPPPCAVRAACCCCGRYKDEYAEAIREIEAIKSEMEAVKQKVRCANPLMLSALIGAKFIVFCFLVFIFCFIGLYIRIIFFAYPFFCLFVYFILVLFCCFIFWISHVCR